jgi:type IX secretion system PorP/SprF family membrane protein
MVATVLSAVVALCAMAQSDAAFSHAWLGKTYYNPAAAGEINAIRLNVGSRMQWVDFKHAPMTFYVTADMPYKLLGQRLGVGVKAEFERIGLYTSTRIGAQVAYKRKMGKCMLSVGVQPGVYSQIFRGKEVIMPEDDAHQGNDEAIPRSNVSGTAFDANVGVYFTHPRFWTGFAVTHVTSPRIELKTSREAVDFYEFNASRSYYFMAGGNIPINNSLFEIQPSGMFGMSKKAWAAQIATVVRYNRMLNIGVGYRHKDAVSAFIGVNLKDAYLGYCYDYPVSAISRATFGSHEVFVTYNVKLENREKNKNRQKGVRLM